MAKKAITPIRRYSSSDQCLIALLLEPIKRSHEKKSDMKPIKKSEELLRYITLCESMSKVPIFSSTTT